MSSIKVKSLQEIIRKLRKSNISICSLNAIENHSTQMKLSTFRIFTVISFVIVIIATFCAKIWLYGGEKCLVSVPDTLSHAFRPPLDCNFCRNVTQADRVSNIFPRDFEAKYAYNAKPVIVTDATRNWTAHDVFDFWYFKDVYNFAQSHSERMNCQFFPVNNFNCVE